MTESEVGTLDDAMCSRCIMRSVDDPDLVLTNGVCNHCLRYDELISSRVVPGEAGRTEMDRLVKKIRSQSRGDYDCLIGVSGGVDSSYVALKVAEYGLRPLAVHVDTGWNSNTAVENIQKTLDKLGIELHTEVLDLREFYDLQRSFLLASTPDGDIPADHAIQATLWKLARRNRIRYIISGMNFQTESISVPAWAYGHSDWKYIRDVQRRHGTRPLKKYPHFGFLQLFYTTFVKRVRIVSILNYLDYDKAAALDTLSRELDWTNYGGKHFESIYTRYYQGHVLPRKFGIDKRRGHLSDLINSGQLTRDEALALMHQTDYPEELRRRDEELVLKKLSLSPEEFRVIWESPRRTFRDFRNSYETVQRLRRLVNVLRARGWYPR
jgi:N-acetyl sugar amidotransferase